MTYLSCIFGSGLGLSKPSSNGCGFLSWEQAGLGAGVVWSLLTLFSVPSMSMTKVESSASTTTNGPMAMLASLLSR